MGYLFFFLFPKLMEITLSFEILTACRLLLGEKLQWEKDDSTSIRKVFGFSLDFCFFFSFFSFFFFFPS